MKMRIAIIAACAGTFALAQTDLAQAAYAGAAGSMSSVSSAYGGADPVIKLAQNTQSNKAREKRNTLPFTKEPGMRKHHNYVGTVTLVKGYKNKEGKRVRLYEDKKGRVGLGMQTGRWVCFAEGSGHGQRKRHCIPGQGAIPARRAR